MASHSGIGLMSGTSLDGLDVCLVEFTGDIDTDVWSYCIKKAKTLPYTAEWRHKLKNAPNLSGVDLMKLHFDYGHFVGENVRHFIRTEGLKVDFVAAHGHTVFHQPENGFTFQLGDGETIATYFQCPFVCNFRYKDVALGGQGAPLVPSAEKYLFSQTDICVNLGGIANIGLRGMKGYDMCPCNIVLNHLAGKYDKNKTFDQDGEIASRGAVNSDLLEKLENLGYYKEPPPKSLGIEWVSKEIFPLLDTSDCSIQDLMRTFVEHITNRISAACMACSRRASGPTSVLITGGGAFNKFLMKTLREKLTQQDIKVQETDDDTIEFKEALVFAFLGLRSLLGMENVVSQITGSRVNTVSGSIHRPLLPMVSSPTIQDQFNFLMKRQSLQSVPVLKPM